MKGGYIEWVYWMGYQLKISSEYVKWISIKNTKLMSSKIPSMSSKWTYQVSHLYQLYQHASYHTIPYHPIPYHPNLNLFQPSIPSPPFPYPPPPKNNQKTWAESQWIVASLATLPLTIPRFPQVVCLRFLWLVWSFLSSLAALRLPRTFVRTLHSFPNSRRRVLAWILA